MVMMGIDLGTVRTGISLCDKDEILAYPFCVIEETDSEKLSNRIVEICKKNNVERILIGYPKNMDGSVGERALRSESFKKLLSKYFDKEIILWDERLTTVCSQKNFRSLNINSRKQKKIIDKASATVLLQSYMNSKPNKI